MAPSTTTADGARPRSDGDAGVLAAAETGDGARPRSGSGNGGGHGGAADGQASPRSRSSSFTGAAAGATNLLRRLRSMSTGAGGSPPGSAVAVLASPARSPPTRSPSSGSFRSTTPGGASSASAQEDSGRRSLAESDKGSATGGLAPPAPVAAVAAASTLGVATPSPAGGARATTPSGPGTTEARRSFWGRWLQQQQQQLQTVGVSALASPPPVGASRLELSGESASAAAVDERPDADLLFWAEIVHGGDAAVKRRAKQVAERVRNGIPANIRGIVWQTLCNGKDPVLEERYRSLIRQPSQWDREITRDIDRTYPAHAFFSKAGQQALFNVLKAYALYDPEVGYCQGQAFVAGLLLMHMPEEEAFSMFVRLLEDYQLRPLYKEGMEGTHVRAFQLNALVQEQLPALHRHMEEAGVQPLMYASQWFMALFATDLPLGVVLRVIDVMLVEGADVVLRVALALLRANQDALLKLKFEGMLDHLRHHMYNEAAFRDPSDLIADAFRTRLSERRLSKLEQEGRAHLELTNREKTEMVHLRQERRDAESRARALEAKLSEAEAENLRIAGELAGTKLSLASALASIEDMERALRQSQRLMVSDSDERLAEIGRLQRDLRAIERQNHELAKELIDVKLRYADSHADKEHAEHMLDRERRRKSSAVVTPTSAPHSTSTTP